MLSIKNTDCKTYLNGIMWPRTYPITIPVKRAIVKTLELATSFVYPFFMSKTYAK